MAAPAPAPAGGGNLLTQRLGPLATWVWLIIGTVLIAIVYLYLKHKQGSSSSSSSTGQATAGQTAGVQDVPDIILQNFNQTPGGTTTAATPPPAATPPSQPTAPTAPAAPAPVQTIGAGAAPAAPGIHEYTGNGSLTLAQVAKQHNTTPAKILASTKQYKNNISKTLGAYLNAGNWNKPIPKGTTIVYQDG